MQVSKKTCGILKWFESPHLHAAILLNCALYALMFTCTCINEKAVYAAKASLLNIFNISRFIFIFKCL